MRVSVSSLDLVSGNPSGIARHILPGLLASELFDDIAQSDPEQSDGDGRIVG